MLAEKARKPSRDLEDAQKGALCEWGGGQQRVGILWPAWKLLKKNGPRAQKVAYTAALDECNEYSLLFMLPSCFYGVEPTNTSYSCLSFDVFSFLFTLFPLARHGLPLGLC